VTSASTETHPTASAVPTRRYTFGDAVRSEWTKIRTVRATFWCLVISTVLGVGLAALVSWGSARHYASDPTDHLSWDPVQRSLAPLLIAQLVFAVFGVITVTAEYSTGMIRTTLTAVPKRGRLLAAKLLVFTLVALAAGQIIAFASFWIGQALIHGEAPSASIAHHLVLRAVIGAGLYLALLGLLGAAIGFIVRNAGAGIAVLVALLFVAPLILLLLPNSWYHTVHEYWPTEAGRQVYSVQRGSHALSAWLGFGWMALFTAAVIAAALVVLQRRDA
jgi:ABC-type transport system involved in multi-copper enzyme maturation permease subunit